MGDDFFGKHPGSHRGRLKGISSGSCAGYTYHKERPCGRYGGSWRFEGYGPPGMSPPPVLGLGCTLIMAGYEIAQHKIIEGYDMLLWPVTRVWRQMSVGLNSVPGMVGCEWQKILPEWMGSQGRNARHSNF